MISNVIENLNCTFSIITVLFKNSLTFIYSAIHSCGYTWQSEDNFQESVLVSPSTISSPGTELRLAIMLGGKCHLAGPSPPIFKFHSSFPIPAFRKCFLSKQP